MFESTYGLFTINAESRTSWFSYWGDSQESEMIDEYNLLGKLIGLAFYNGVALDVNFAPVLYKKILKAPVGLEDVAGFDPELYAGLKKLLEYEGDVENVYCRTYAVDAVTPLGKKVGCNLIPNGLNIAVTIENRQDFVEKYVDFLFNTSIAKQFTAFENGLKSVLDGSGISLFRPEELQELICGSPSLDFKVLEESTVYDGYDSESPVIR
jgi:HECT-domain (ubiquitin-transferase)